MTRFEAYELIKRYHDRPVFSVKIGMCSPQLESVTFEYALQAMDQADRFTTEFLEYVYIYAEDYVTDYHELNQALVLFNLGPGRHALNTKRFT